MFLFLTDPSRMDRDREKTAKRILNFTLEIIYLLTGEDYTIVKKTCGVTGARSKSQCPIKEPPIHFLMFEKKDEQKILNLTYKMIELLTGEGEDIINVKVEGTPEEETNQLCKEEEIPVDISPDEPRDRNSPENCPLYSEDWMGEDHVVSQDHEDEELIAIKVEALASEEETFVRDDQQCKVEAIPVDISPDGFTKDLKRNLLFSSNYGVEDNIDYGKSGKPPLRSNLSLVIQSKGLPPDHCERMKPYFGQNVGLSRGKIFPCSECGKLFKHKSSLSIHKRTHNDERPYSCSECGKCFTQKSILVEHERIHTGEKPFSCGECGRCFAQKSALVKHERTHTGEKPYLCLECGKCFTQKSSLVKHQRSHTGHKPFSCLKCGKCFTHKSDIMRHERTHTGEKPFSCTDCGKHFNKKLLFVNHKRIHNGEKPFPCLECGKGLTLT